VEIEKIVDRIVEVPDDRIIEVPVERVVEVPVDRIVEVPVERIVEVPVEKIVEVPISPSPLSKPPSMLPFTSFLSPASSALKIIIANW